MSEELEAAAVPPWVTLTFLPVQPQFCTNAPLVLVSSSLLSSDLTFYPDLKVLGFRFPNNNKKGHVHSDLLFLSSLKGSSFQSLNPSS